jgi:hypothetical protein
VIIAFSRTDRYDQPTADLTASVLKSAFQIARKEMAMTKLMASEEVLQYALAMAERAKAQGKATDMDVMIATMQLCLRMLRDKDRSGEELTEEEAALLDELRAEMERKAALAGIDLEEHDDD